MIILSICFSPSKDDIDKSETAPLFPSNAPSASISPTTNHTGTINRTLLHHQQAHSGAGIGSAGGGGTLGHSHRNGHAGLRTGLVPSSSNTHNHNSLLRNNRTYAAVGGGSGVGGRASPSPPPGYDVVVHGTRHGLY